ncbi:NADH-quinone oxidoreductase subunit 5 family protein [Mucilaginibacter gotjawali]|uniref:NADH-quinone oxidoreductase subunit L n=2 Tax=Mucilaginibacter gotjawali TaxID=1550579 RepID=A0A839SBQ1_9SPHI|nr:NADH-quinone oxidoreductase subunit L [Mucilaginibacter gotjawali]MBB3055575.1 NADH-quinone oxidoreductase subunit L [Mucilaginibacter gotjawali]BAU53142.1 NADH-quinone oxidoreductase subunit L [Mucilaginibacter gotjawali]
MSQFLQSIDALTIKFTLIAVLLPLLAFVVNTALPAKWSKASGWVSAVFILISGILSAFIFSRVWNGHQVHRQLLWFTIGDTPVYAGLLLNNLSVLLLLLVNLIAFPVHLYSTAYMRHDEKHSRYFAYLSFFCFSMLALVVVDNLVLFYVFWELVGFSSYLLIGFWFTRDSAVFANKKAFIMNRIGDIGLLTAILVLFTMYHTFDLDTLFGQINLVKNSAIQNGVWHLSSNSIPNSNGAIIITGGSIQLPAIWQYIAFAGIFLAVAAKSAQFPLHTWLPDAMEGPTSVSALIHAATMVAAGVFLLGRVYPLFNDAELTFLAIIGCFTAFMAATIALTQNDLKRILAYSTISQLGYMVMAMGIGAYASSLFHLVTHAFFKCLLFLVAGIVIHQMGHIRDDNNIDIDPQNIQHMGGLRKKMPLTFIAALIGGVALVGLPFTSGFLSKDGILVQTFEWSAGRNVFFRIIPVLALITTWLTAFYVARLIVKVFFGELRVLQLKPELKLHISDGAWQYKLPLVLLSVCCFFPFFSANPFSADHSWLLGGLTIVNGHEIASLYQTLVPVVVNVLSLLVIWYGYLIYTNKRTNPFAQTGVIFNLSFNQWYVDSIYQNAIVKPILNTSLVTFWFDRRVIDGFILLFAKMSVALSKLAAWTDRNIVDGFLNLLVKAVRIIGNFARRFQGGKVQYYLFSMLAVILAIFILILLDVRF